MNKLLITIIGAGLGLSSCSDKSVPDKIEVLGQAEAEITPDIVYVGISLREYFKPGTTTRVPIQTLENDLQESLKASGIDPKNLLVNNVAGYQEYYRRRRNPEFLSGKQYRLKLPDVNKLDDILKELDPKGIQYTQIESYDYSKIDSLKKDLQIKALRAAKDKANYLASSIDKELGEAIEVSEVNEYMSPNRTMNTGNMAGLEVASQAMSPVNFKTIKLSYHMRAVFEMD